MKKAYSFFSVSALALLAAMPAVAQEATAAASFFADGDAGLDLRYRLELVDQDGFSKNATASTLLSKIWYKTAEVNGFSAYVEGTNVIVIGKELYNSTVNGNILRPVVADPEVTEFNQGYVQYRTEKLTLKAGRQGINLGHQRFVGTVGFRQNDQTYDAASAIFTPAKNLTATYSYVWNINRIFGNSHPFGDLDTNTQFVNVIYSGFEFAKITAYAYLIDLNDAPVFGLSSSTYGARLEGNKAVSDKLKLGYQLEYASQSDYKDNPNNYSADYWNASLSASSSGLTGQIAYELLGSDNGVAFQTPLATLHKFNGWADKFLSTPGAGLEDLNASIAYKAPGKTGLGGTLFKVVYHDFSSDVGNSSFGTEWDFLISKKVTKHITASVKAAFYNADNFATDTSRFWFTVGAKF